MKFMNPPMGNAINLANSNPQTNRNMTNEEPTQEEVDHGKQMQILTRIKMKLDVIAVVLLIGYLGYSLLLLNKKYNGKK